MNRINSPGKMPDKKSIPIEVLVATIDTAFVEATLVEDGRLATKVTFHVRNNQKQFLRVQLPEHSIVWSTFVADNPVKPATDAQRPGTVLVSLNGLRLLASKPD